MEFLVYQSKVAVCLAVLYLFFRVLMGGVRLHARVDIGDIRMRTVHGLHAIVALLFFRPVSGIAQRNGLEFRPLARERAPAVHVGERFLP